MGFNLKDGDFAEEIRVLILSLLPKPSEFLTESEKYTWRLEGREATNLDFFLSLRH